MTQGSDSSCATCEAVQYPCVLYVQLQFLDPKCVILLLSVLKKICYFSGYQTIVLIIIKLDAFCICRRKGVANHLCVMSKLYYGEFLLCFQVDNI